MRGAATPAAKINRFRLSKAAPGVRMAGANRRSTGTLAAAFYNA